MLIIGELLNSTRKVVKEALQAKDEATIRRLAREQVEAGADILDINTATSMEEEIDDLRWVIGLVHDEVGKVRLAIDTLNPKAMAAGLELCQARPVINSINNDPRLQQGLIPLVKECDADIIGLTMGGKTGMPKTVEERLQEAEQLINTLEEVGVSLHRLFIDPLVMSIGSNPDQVRVVIDTIREIKSRYGSRGVKTTTGLSNVSFGLPSRTLLNQAFLAMLLEAGLDMAVINPRDEGMKNILRASEALLGIDAHCLQYIRHIRSKMG
ncbi:MAG: methyltetrahydrofolate cobalamin methyltransferase [Dehalococcoidia bacterium]|nr:MAG: methyltetrahydrofolate cobalamin methyltransferase [Dehalococcoidia bacterium]